MKAYLKVIAILSIPLAFILLYAYTPMQLPPPGWKLSKISISGKGGESLPESMAEDTLSDASEEGRRAQDTTAQRILFFGDSMVEGLLRRMNDYAFANGYSMTNVVWYSSTTEIWAQTDTLRHFLQEVKPTFVMVSLGANEQFVKKANERELYIRYILRQLGTTPYIWIGTPAWKEDTGINDLTKRIVGKERYFDSRQLELQRGSDHMHPTFGAASEWMDSVAVWMQGPQTAHPIRMTKPEGNTGHHFRTHVLQPIKW